MADNKRLSIILALLLVIFSLISFFGLSKMYSDPETFSKTVSVLDEEKNTIAKLSGASFAAAAAIDLIPGEAGKSISQALVDLGGCFVLIFAAIYLEKILLAIGGAAAFKVLIPLGCIAMALFIVFKKEPLKKAGIKLIAVGLVTFLLVPTSVWISQRVESVYESAGGTTVEETIDSLDSETSTINGQVSDDEGNIVKSLFGKAKAIVTGSLEKLNGLIDKTIEAVAFFIVTTCVLPIVVMILMILLINQVLGTNISAGSVLKTPLLAKSAIKRRAAGADDEE